ncbi:MAG: putative glycoside hydrolase [bacterium]
MLFQHRNKILWAILLSVPVFLLLSFSPQKMLEEGAHRTKKRSHQGIYITHYYAQSPKLLAGLMQQAKQSGIDTLVIDSKWFLEKPFLELVKQKKLNDSVRVFPDPWFAQLVKEMHDDGFIVTARLVAFKDDHLVLGRRDLGIQLGNDIYRDHKGGKWSDPYSSEVRLFNALIAERAAMCGVDEIQFDYIRFPAEGKASQAVCPFEQEGVSRVDIICQFLKEVRERVKKYNTSIAVDIFGVTAWQSKNDIEALGQDVKRMAPYIDVLSPMLYPSHFHAGYDGFANPGSQPYHFMSEGVRKTKEILSVEAVAIVPWIQGFNLRSPNYGPDYISEQVKACRDEGAEGFLIWNARNDYDQAFSALKKK